MSSLDDDVVLGLLRTLTAPGDVRRITAEIATAAVDMTRAFGAYIESIVSLDREVEVLAADGSGTPQLNTRVPYPGSLTEEIIEGGSAHRLSEIGAIGESMAPYLAKTCRNCTGLIVPMLVERRPAGALVLLREPDQGSFSDAEVDMAVLLSDLANIALQRHAAERDMREREQRFRSLAENAADAIITIAQDDVVLFVNPVGERIFGYTAAEMLGQPFSMLIPERFRERHRAGMARYLATGRRNIPWDGIELPGLHRDGHEVPLEVTFGAYIHEGRHIFTGMMRDITARVEAQEERQRLLAEAQHQSNEAAARRAELEHVVAGKARLIRGFAHDIKNPLGAATGRADLMLGEIVGDLTDATREQVEGIRRSLGTALELVNTLVEFSRIDAGQIELINSPTQLAQLTRQVADDHTAEAQRKGIELRVEERDAPEIVTDAARVRQILDNLLSNAIKYTASGHVCVTVECATEEDQQATKVRAAIRVADTGRGIPTNRIGELFDEFSRIDPVDHSGAGLGLAISHRLARLLGGEITVWSEEGSGSRFSLLL